MRVYLDDIRQHPNGWERAYTAPEAIELLKTGKVTEMSLDHDLGDDPAVGDGYDVVKWIEEQVHVDENFVLPEIKVHSANPVAHARMSIALNRVYITYSTRKGGGKS